MSYFLSTDTHTHIHGHILPPRECRKIRQDIRTWHLASMFVGGRKKTHTHTKSDLLIRLPAVVEFLTYFFRFLGQSCPVEELVYFLFRLQLPRHIPLG